MKPDNRHFYRFRIPAFSRVPVPGGPSLAFTSGDVPRLVIQSGNERVDIWEGQCLPMGGNGNEYLCNPYSFDVDVNILRGLPLEFAASPRRGDWFAHPKTIAVDRSFSAHSATLSAKITAGGGSYGGHKWSYFAPRKSNYRVRLITQNGGFDYSRFSGFDPSILAGFNTALQAASATQWNTSIQQMESHDGTSYGDTWVTKSLGTETEINAHFAAFGLTRQNAMRGTFNESWAVEFSVAAGQMLVANLYVGSSTSTNTMRFEAMELGLTAEQCEEGLTRVG